MADYIPSNIESFNTFQIRINDQATANAAAWNIPAAEITSLNTWSGDFRPLYEAAVNKNARSRQDVLDYNAYRANFEQFLRGFCQSFLTNNLLIPVGERVALGLNPRGVNPPTPRPDITTAPIPSLTPMGGGMVKLTFKVAESNTRIARHPDSNGIEVYWLLEPLNGTTPPVTEDGELLEEAKEPYEVMFNSRAQFNKSFGLENIGKRLRVYARWVNTSDAEKSGPFCTEISLVVS